MTTEYSIQKMVSNGTLSTIALGIQYLQRNDIYIRIAGKETPQSGASSGYTWSFVDNTTIKILPVVPNGVEVVVYRRTDADSMYNVYSQNAQFDEATVDENNTQLLFLSQEYLEQGSGLHMMRITHADGDNGYFRVFTASAANPILRLGTEGIANCSVQLEAAGIGEVIVNRDLRASMANARKCGTPVSPWSGGNTQAAFTVTSDERYKTAPITITDIMLDAWAEVDWVQYQFLDRVEEKGVDGARWHFGVIAQRCMEAFSRHGLDATRFAFLCHDEWQSSDEVLDEEGNITIPAVEAGSRYGIRYEEALALEAALQRRNYQRLLARVEALEVK